MVMTTRLRMHQESATKVIIILFFLKKTVQLRERQKKTEKKMGRGGGSKEASIEVLPSQEEQQLRLLVRTYSNNYIHAAYVTIMQSLIPSNESSQRNHIF